MDSTQRSNYTAKAMKRYWNAYLVARTTAGIGGAIKVFAFLSGITVAVIGLYLGQQRYGSPNPIFQYRELTVGPNHIFQFGGLVAGVVVVIPLYILGVLVAARGQMLKASLDEAVHTSPFLTDEQRAAVMSL
jgi:hypothetical protein